MDDAGSKRSSARGQLFGLAHCANCRFSCVTNPRTDFDCVYDRAYYEGRGADPSVDYERELADHRTIRAYEWRGILRLVQSLQSVSAEVAWLDYGCGLGGFVRSLRDHGVTDAVGFDQGYA